MQVTGDTAFYRRSSSSDDADRPSDSSQPPADEFHDLLAYGPSAKGARDAIRALLGAYAVATKSASIQFGGTCVQFRCDLDLSERFQCAVARVIADERGVTEDNASPCAIARQIWRNFQAAPEATRQWFAKWAAQSVPQGESFNRWTGHAKGAVLQLARGEGTRLDGVELIGMNLNGLKLPSVCMTGSHIRWVSARGADLSGACLRDGHWRNAVFAPLDDDDDVFAQPADFRNADLSGTALDDVSLQGAQCQGARLLRMRRLAVDFSQACLDDAHISLDPQAFARLPDCGLRNDDDTGSARPWGVLHSIASIDARHVGLKRELMHQFIDIVRHTGRAESLVWDHIDIWLDTLEDPLYWADLHVTAFIDDFLPMGLLPKWNVSIMPADLTHRQLAFYMQYLLDIAAEPGWVTSCQGAIHQIVDAARAHASLNALAHALCDTFHSHEDVAPAVGALEAVLPGLAQDTCLFIDAHRLDAVACEPALLRAVARRERLPPWGHVYCLSRPAPDAPFAVVPNGSPLQALLPSRLLHDAYVASSCAQRQLCASVFDALLPPPASTVHGIHGSHDDLDTGDAVEASDTSEEFDAVDTVDAADAVDAENAADVGGGDLARERFLHAVMAACGYQPGPDPAPDLTSHAWQLRLPRMLSPCLLDMPDTGVALPRQVAGARLRAPVRRAMLEALAAALPVLHEMTHGPAAMLLIESLRHVRLSSSLGLGTETSSPYALRQTACALLNEAMAMSASLVTDATASAWRDVLVGNTPELARCTAMLAGDITAHVLSPSAPRELRLAYDAIYPHAWR
ncbi:pentapeptide repeat-containing protein [Pandoraea pulmonicola]|uniref:E3 ubiquitin-protein ligase SopA n=1 Tax=Pandoraea pulmonicola TaxID=93221 RepID=A0AAJ4ZFV9_PANPU|nr:pentapeptide repeat-containing protein [Pandoraea pulmonicola]AJC19364.1 hypothetical protein RO07_00605 [Pandoraea pulmonicola]SUA92638.1 E3 ubiquitin-protein ligase SopA [Pandoraea pulmonicola]